MHTQQINQAANLCGMSAYEASRAELAVASLKASGKITVRPSSRRGYGTTFTACRLRSNGTEGMSISDGETEAQAWLAAAIYLAEYKPGEMQMTSREFSSTWTANILCKDGRLGMLERRLRLEIRKLHGQFEVFLVQRRYLRGEQPADVLQQQGDRPFATLADAAAYVGRYISDFNGASADDQASAMEAQRSDQWLLSN